MAWSAPGTWPPPAGRSPRWSGLTGRAAPSTLVRNPFSRYATSRRRSTGREPRRLPLSRDPGARQGAAGPSALRLLPSYLGPTSPTVRPSTRRAGRDSAGSPPPRNGGEVMPIGPPSLRPAPGARHGQSLRGRVAGGGSRTTSGSISAHGSSPVSFGGSMHRSTSLNRRWQQANRDKARAQDRRDRERKRQDPDYWVRRRGRDRLYRARKRARLSNTPPEANDG